MPQIPSNINGVAIEFNPTVNRDVDQRVMDALKHCIKREIAGATTSARSASPPPTTATPCPAAVTSAKQTDNFVQSTIGRTKEV